MAKVQLSVACWDYDRVRPLIDGRVVAEGLDLVFLPLTPEEAFFRAFRNAEFDVSELSLSTTLMLLSQGKCPYMPLPVFPSRAFRHSCIYVRPGAGIAKPQDLKGRRVGIPEYQVTAAMVARGVLADEYGVQPTDIHWVQGGVDEAGRIDKVQWTPPSGLKLDKVMDRPLSDLIAAGELDAIVAPRAPRAFRPAGDGPLVRLFPDHDRVEADWYGKTGIFPVMHVLGVRNDVLERHPWVAMSLVKAFTTAKDMALADLAQVAALKTSLPFLPAHVAQAHRLFGNDFWPYGVDANRATLDAELRWSHEQGLSARKVEIADLFAPQSVLGHRV